MGRIKVFWADLKWAVQRWVDDVILFFSPPELLLPTSKEIGVLVEIIPGSIDDVVGKSEHASGDTRRAVNDSGVLQPGSDPIVDVKILSAGLPLYILTENRLLIAGKLVQSLPVRCDPGLS